jgi:hypothetical protein
MLKNDRGSHIGDLRASGEPIDDEGVEGIGVRDADMDQEVLGTRDDENIKGLRQPAGELAEGLDSLPGRWADAYRDERLHGPAEGIQVDVGVKAPEHSSSSQCANSLQRRRGRNADPIGEGPVRQPCICLELSHQCRI